MAGAEANHDSHALDQTSPTDLLLQGANMWQMPMVLGTAWWKIWMEAACSQSPAMHQEHRQDDHDQFVVPDPVDVESEHALFA